MKHTLLFLAFSVLSTASFAKCLTDKQAAALHANYKKAIQRMDQLNKTGDSKDEKEIRKLHQESVAAEKQIEYQENHCL